MELFTFALSVTGASHSKINKENQDSVNFGNSPPFVALADGHGSKKYIRSSFGAFAATKAIEQVIIEHFPIYNNININSKDLEELIRHMKMRFLLLWQQSVLNDLKNNPLNEDEIVFLENNLTNSEILSIENNPKIIFGTTFLCAVVYIDFVLVLKYGDGDILGVYQNKDIDKVMDIMESDDRNFGGSTLSIASIADASSIKHKIFTNEEIPNLIMLSTDGIKNSYNDKVHEEISQFYKIPIVIKNELKKDMNIQKKLENFLKEVTLNGSGDDVSIGIIYKKDFDIR
ncbi:MAG: protein phosphatase 2C domain-containing protein [Defluviitaleaceae bacterium]|nr:protein phosphatase 2C domain-containing protein [Defluviitaleaceae bacterium]